MPPDPYVINHIHTDGPIPGPHSLLTLSSAAYTADGDLIGTFGANVRELPGATLHPVALQTWRERPEDWLTTRRAARPPAAAIGDYARWIDRIPGPPTFLADPGGNEYVFLYWYLQRFAGRWPFPSTTTSMELQRLPPPPLCTLSSCRGALAATS